MNSLGLLVGLCSFLLIGLFHPIVIKTEYHTGTRYWWVFLLVGIAAAIAALLIKSALLSCVLGVFAFCCWWSIKELFEQRKRVEKGWFPKKNVFVKPNGQSGACSDYSMARKGGMKSNNK